jgi:hypothetical protein
MLASTLPRSSAVLARPRSVDAVDLPHAACCGVRVKAAEFRNKRDVGVFFKYALFKYKWHGRWNAEHA